MEQTIEFITVREASELLRCNYHTLREAIRRHEVPGVIRVGRLIRIKKADLLTWAEKLSVIPRGK